MAHDITIRDNGIAEAAFALTPAWHNLGTVLDHPMSSLEALQSAHLDWDVLQRPVGVVVPQTIETPEGEVTKETFTAIPDMVANVRSDSGKVLGIVSRWYKTIQNREAFAFLDKLIENKEMTYESAFSLSGGKKVVLLGRLPETDQIAHGDETLRYILLSLCHDGTGAIKFGPTAVRVVCANTYGLALSKGTIQDVEGLSIGHMGDIEGKLQKARDILVLANQSFTEHAEQSRLLAQKRLTAAEWEAYLNIMCPIPDVHDPDYTEKRAERIAETRDAIRAAYHNERQSLPGIEHTAWAAFNAVTEHIDHLPRRGSTQVQKSEARFNVTMYGPGRDMKKRAFEAACRFAGVTIAV
jgi:phage/plasmid-like protein (TIGR03299 family)